METDLEQMSREQLIAEVEKLRKGIATAADMSSVGIILNFGGYYRRKPIPFLWFRSGPNLFNAA